VERVRLTRQITARLLAFEPLLSAKAVCMYHAFDGEPDLSDLIERSVLDGKTVYLPSILADDTMCMRKWTGVDQTVAGKYGIIEPIENVSSHFSAEIALIPGIGFSRTGNRLGFGKGYYDRFLSDFDMIRVGVCFSEQICDLMEDPWDVPMDYIVTQNEIIDCRKEKSL